MKPLGGCNCTYSDNSQCFFRCMDGKWYMSEGCFIFFPDCTLNRYYIDKSQCFFTFMDGKWDMACI